MEQNSSACKKVVHLYDLFVLCANQLQSVILLVFRLYWGYRLFLTGKGKLLNHENTTAFFDKLGIPMPGLNAWFVGGVECIGGLLLIVGLFSRPTALLITITMLVAYITADTEALMGIFTDPKPFLMAAPFFFLLTGLLVLAFGPGKIALDTFVRKWVCGAKCDTPCESGGASCCPTHPNPSIPQN